MPVGIRRAVGIVLTLNAVITLFAIACASALAVPHFDGHFPVPKNDPNNDKIAAGPDGNMWLVIHEGENDVAKIKPDGSFEEFELEGVEGASGIAVGPEQKMWVTQINKVASFEVADPKKTTHVFTINDVTSDNPIVAGPDGQMWVGASENIVHFKPSEPEKAQSIPANELSPKDIDVAGSLIVVADANHKHLLTINPSNTAEAPKEIPLLGSTTTAQGVAGSPTGQIAFSKSDGTEGLGLVTPPGAPTAALMPGDPFGVARGSDGAFYIAMSAADNVERLTPEGTAAPIEGFPPKFFPRQIAAGPNNTIWVSMEIPGENVYEVARISGLEPPVVPILATPKAPETKIAKGPKKKVKTTGKTAKVAFRFNSSTAGAKFECALTAKAKKGKKAKKPKFKGCKSPKTYTLKPGKYKFSVRAVIAGLADPSPATKAFSVVHVKR